MAPANLVRIQVDGEYLPLKRVSGVFVLESEVVDPNRRTEVLAAVEVNDLENINDPETGRSLHRVGIWR